MSQPLPPLPVLPFMHWLQRANLCGLALQQGILDKYNVELIGAKLPSIDKAEDRELFKQAGSLSAESNVLQIKLQ